MAKMRTIKQTSQFKKDLKREAKGEYREIIESEFDNIVEKLAKDELLPDRLRDHVMTGNWKDHRDCHIRPNLVLIYRKLEDEHILQLVRLGSHSELEI
jgi:mRNA interferase YafQ